MKRKREKNIIQKQLHQLRLKHQQKLQRKEQEDEVVMNRNGGNCGSKQKYRYQLQQQQQQQQQWHLHEQCQHPEQTLKTSATANITRIVTITLTTANIT
jgi:hypothetical protein